MSAVMKMGRESSAVVILAVVAVVRCRGQAMARCLFDIVVDMSAVEVAPVALVEE